MREMRIGRWSELRETDVDQEREVEREGEAMEMSGEEGGELEGRRVGESRLMERREE